MGRHRGKTQNFTVSMNNEGTGCEGSTSSPLQFQACMSHPMVVKSGRLVGPVTLNDTINATTGLSHFNITK